jgi:hypothetical protein
LELEAEGANKDYAYIKEVQALSDEFTKMFDEMLREQSLTMIQDTGELILLLLKDLAKIMESR